MVVIEKRRVLFGNAVNMDRFSGMEKFMFSEKILERVLIRTADKTNFRLLYRI